MMIFHEIIITVVTVLNLVFFRGKPSQKNNQAKIEKESDSGLEKNSTEQVAEPSYISTLKTCLTTGNYLKILVGFMIILSIMNTFNTNIELMIKPFGYNSVLSS